MSLKSRDELETKVARRTWWDGAGQIMCVTFWRTPRGVVYLRDDLAESGKRDAILREHGVTMREHGCFELVWIPVPTARLEALHTTKRWSRVRLKANDKRLARSL